MEKEKKYYIYRLSMVAVNVLATLISVVLILLTAFIYNENFYIFEFFNNLTLTTMLIGLFGYCALHELLHGLGYYLLGGKWNRIVFGIKLELGIFYCLCKQNIKRKNILVSCMLPFLILGVAAYIIAIIFALPGLLCLSIFNIGGCAGDIVTFLFIRKLKNVEFSEMDDVTSFAIYSATDISKTKHFGLTYVESKDKLERDNLKKITISKGSIIAVIVLVILALIEYL